MAEENDHGFCTEEQGALAQNSGKLKTTAPAPVAPQDVVAKKRKPGGQPGNRNAFKTGVHTAHSRAVFRGVRRLKRRADAAVAAVNKVIREQKLARRRAAKDS